MKRGADEGSSEFQKKARAAFSGVPSNSQFSHLGVACQAEFHSLFHSGKVVPSDIDESIYKSLLDFNDQTATEIVQGFSRADLSNVRNKTGFFIGILKTYRKKGEGMRVNSAASSSSSSSSAPSNGPPNPAVPPHPVPSHSQTHPPPIYPSYAPPPVPYPNYDPYSMPPMPPADPYAAAYGYPPPSFQYPAYPYPPYPAYVDPQYVDPSAQVYPPYVPPPDLANPSTYQERPVERSHAPRRSGGGLTALSKPIQDLFDQIFAVGHVSKEDVPDSIYDSLQGFEEDVQWAIVERFSKADLARVRNKTGYLIGILKIARQGKAAGQGFGSSKLGPPPSANPNSPFDAHGRGSSSNANQNPPMEQSPAFAKLAPYVQQKFRELVRKRDITDGDLDLGVFTSLAAFDETSQIDIIEIFASKDLANIQNKTGFFIGIIKKQRVLKQNHAMVQGWN